LHAQYDMAWAFRVIGVCEQNQGRLGNAHDFFKKAVDGFEAVGAPAQTIDALLVLGQFTWKEEGRVEEAIRVFRTALSAAREFASSVYIAFSLTKLADVSLRAGKYSEARDYNQESLNLWRRTGSSRLVGRGLELLFLAVFRQGEFAEARQL